SKFDKREDLRIEALTYLANSYSRSGEAEEADKLYHSILEKFPDEKVADWARLQLGLAHYEKKAYKKAINLWTEITKNKKAEELRAEAQFRIGDAYLAWGKEDEAIVNYLRVAYLYPNYLKWAASAQYQAATIYERKKKYEEAKKLYQGILKNYKEGEWMVLAKERLEVLESQ
ncbi:tetratricopeptide repeat protein, partial [bacterium]|nr:tetratricopeptide repeat protein [bacterium]